MQKNKHCYIFLAAMLLCAGCHSVNKPGIVGRSPGAAIRNTANAQIAEEKKKHSLILAVTPLAEKRGNLKNYGNVYKYLVPLVPYGRIRYERPDESKMFNTSDVFEFNMSENLAKLLVDAVRKSGLFDSVILTPTPLESKADLVLSGDIQSTLYEGKTYSYGLSFLGPALWCLGLPAGSSHKKLAIALHLRKRDSNEDVWSYILDKEKTVIQGLYHNWGKDVNSFVSLMQEGAGEAIVDMRRLLSVIPIETLKAGQPELPLPAKIEPPAPPPEKPPPESAPQAIEPAQSVPEAIPQAPAQSRQEAVQSAEESHPVQPSATADK